MAITDTSYSTTFDVVLNYRTKNKYKSSWFGYVIVNKGAKKPFIRIPNKNIYNSIDKVIDKVVVESTDGDNYTKEYVVSDEFLINFPVSTSSDTHYKITLFCASDESTGFCAKTTGDENWIPYQSYDNDGTIFCSDIRLVTSLVPMSLVDFNSLLYDPQFSSPSKIALFEDVVGDKYIVIRKPSKNNFPGYYFDLERKKYNILPDAKLPNQGHYIREGILTGDTDNIIYTTGSTAKYVYDKDGNVDPTWNYGATVANYENTSGTLSYPLHSTYGFDIDLEEPPTTGNYGYLFHNTAENLPSYYSIYYKTSDLSDLTSRRFLYKLELESQNEGSQVPVVRSLNFKFNKGI